MKNIFFIFCMSLLFATTAFAEEPWTEVVSTTIDFQSPNYRDILIHNPDTYGEVKIKILSGDAWLDRFDVISFFLWGEAVPDLQGFYKAGEERTALFRTSKVKFVRMYLRSAHPGMPLHVRVWMR